MTDTRRDSLEEAFRILDEPRDKLLILIKDIPLHTIIRSDGKWNLRDILGHLGAWRTRTNTTTSSWSGTRRGGVNL